MFSKLAATWDQSQASGGGGAITSMQLVRSWQGSFSAQDVIDRRSATYYLPVEEGDIVVAVTSNGLNVSGRGYFPGDPYVRYHPGSSRSVPESLLKYNVFWVTNSNGLYFKESFAAMGLFFSASSSTPLKQTNSNVEIKNTHTITIYHLRPNVPFDMASHDLNLNSTVVPGTVATRSSGVVNTNTITTPADSSFTFGIISSDQYINRWTTNSTLWAPINYFSDPYYVYDPSSYLAIRPQPTNVINNLVSNGITLYSNSNNLNTPRVEVGWRWINSVSSWLGSSTSNYAAWRFDTLVIPEAGSTYNMAHVFTWNGSSVSSIFQTVYFSAEITER